MKRVLITATVQSHIALFHTNMAAMLQENGYEVHAAANNDLKDKNGLSLKYIYQLFEVRFSRFPFSFQNVVAYKHIKRIISENKYDVIHCNSPTAGVLTRLAARKLRKKGTKVIYTAHGFHFFKGAPLINWLLYYPIERRMARYTDVLITINKEDYERAKKFKAKQVEYVPGVGIDVEKYANHKIDKEAVRKSLGIPDSSTVLLSVGELNKNKNHQAIIRALAMLNDKNVHYMIAGNGNIEKELRTLAANLNIAGQVHLLGFRTDIADLYKAAHIFCFPSLREGLPVALMEAMAAGLPVICSRIRGNVDLFDDGKGCCLCGANNEVEFTNAIKALLSNLGSTQSMSKHNRDKIQNFCIEAATEKVKEIYSVV